MNLKNRLEALGFDLRSGQEFEAEGVRQIAQIMNSDYVRYVGIESQKQARQAVGTLEDRVPDQPNTDKEFLLQLAFERGSFAPGSEEVYGTINFSYNPKNPGKYFFGDVCEGNPGVN